MQGIAPVSRVYGPRRVLAAPDARSTSADAPRATIEAAEPLSGAHAPAAGAYAPFLAQAFANDNATRVTPMAANAGALTYLLTRDRIDDLPVGFLISKVA